MIEGGAARMRRNGARLFKNPPQPHMCIQDYIQGSTEPCYINVLSWGKIAMPRGPSEPVPLYGGMRVSPPRTENPQVAVFAVMANPEILQLNGKNAQDPKERSALIDLLLDFIEAMNTGVIFTRCHTVLKDRDITGELKEVWMAVQAKRDREQAPQQETWIDAQPPAPQYPQYQDQQQEYSAQPPQYHSSVTFSSGTGNEGSNYVGFSHQAQGTVGQNDHVYQTRQAVAQQYHGNVTQDSYTYRDQQGRQNVGLDQGQQSCPAYPAPQYQFQQLPRQLVPQYINSNVDSNTSPNLSPSYASDMSPNLAPNVNPNIPGHYQQYIALQQQMVGQRQLENVMFGVIKTHTELHQMQQPVHMQNMQQPVPQYESSPQFSMPPSSQMNVLRLGRPHMGVTQKSNANKRQLNSPTKQNKGKEVPENGTKPKSPVKVLQREPLSPERQLPTERSRSSERNNVQVTDLDEEETKTKESEKTVDPMSPTKTSPKRQQTDNCPEGTGADRVETTRDVRLQTLNSAEDNVTIPEKNPPSEGIEEGVSNPNLSNKPAKTKIMVLKRNSSEPNNESKGIAKEPRVVKNGIRLLKVEGQQIYDLDSERMNARGKPVKDKAAEQLNQTLAEVERKLCDSRNGFAHKQKTDSPKRSQTVNNIIKSVFKIHPGTSTDETGRKKANNQARNNGKVLEREEVHQGYTILRKAESTQEDVMSEIAQISIQDCKDTTEVTAVLS